MKLNRRMMLFALLFCCFFFYACRGESVLKRIEHYQAPPYPADGVRRMEVYDLRIRDGNDVPPTFRDTLISDLWSIMIIQLNRQGLSPNRVRSNDVELAITWYQDRDWSQIVGYRPWTHWNFIRGLSDREKTVLIQEVVEYVEHYGVKDYKIETSFEKEIKKLNKLGESFMRTPGKQ